MRGNGWLSGIVFILSTRKSLTHCGSTVGLAFGMINEGEEWRLLEGRNQPAVMCCCSSICQESRYFFGQS